MISVQALRWRGFELELIDQRLLPHTLSYVRCQSAAEVAAAIRDLVVRGAPAIGCAAAYAIALEANLKADAGREAFDKALDEAFTLLQESRPTAVNLRWALDRMRSAHGPGSPEDPKEAAALLDEVARTIFQEDLSANLAIGDLGASLIPAGSRIMTHCNTGALATSGHGTALGVIRSAHQQGKKYRSSPMKQGLICKVLA
jgi:methylthioribose-1-phosphate isomerase